MANKKSIQVEVEEVKFEQADKDLSLKGAYGTSVRADLGDAKVKTDKAGNVTETSYPNASHFQTREVGGTSQAVYEGQFIVTYPNGTQQVVSKEELDSLGKEKEEKAATAKADISDPAAQLAKSKLEDSHASVSVKADEKLVASSSLPDDKKK